MLRIRRTVGPVGPVGPIGLDGPAPPKPKRLNILGLIDLLRSMGLTSLNRQLASLGLYSSVSGISQAGLLVLISELAVNRAENKPNLNVLGLSISTHRALLGCVGLLLMFFAASMISVVVSSAMASAAVESGRRRVIDTFFTSSWDIQSEERLGHVQQLLTVNCENIGYTTIALATLVQSSLGALTLLLAAFIVNPLTAAIVLVVGILLVGVMRPFMIWSRNASVRLSGDSQRMATLVTEFTRLARDFRLLGVQEGAVVRLQQRNRQAALSYRKNRLLAQSGPAVYTFLALGFVVIGMAVLLGHAGKDLGATGAILILTLRSLNYGSAIQNTNQVIRSFQGFLEGLSEDVDRFDASRPDTTGNRLPDRFDVTFSGVTFAYGGGPDVLRDITFHQPSGDILGVVGRSGSGKTTLSQLVLGLRVPRQGRVLLGDVPAVSVAKGNGVSPIALVPQEPILLQGSIAMNISFFRDVSQEQIEQAAKAAHVHDDILAMPLGYDTTVGEGGGALSGGQRQRLAIARALIGSPRVLVLDEPTSALDGRSESLIRQSLAALRGRVTVMIISHRLAMVEDCDHLLVLDAGELADFGPRVDVMARAPFRHVADKAEPNGARKHSEPQPETL